MKHLIFALQDGSVQVAQPGPPRAGEPEQVWLDRVARKCCPEGANLVAVVDASDLPPREHREAWVWNGERIVVDESRIRPRRSRLAPASSESIPAPPADLDSLRNELAAHIAATFVRIEQDLNQRLASLERTILRATRAYLESVAVAHRVEAGEPVDPQAVPTLVAEIEAEGKPVTVEAIIEAADRHVRAAFTQGEHE